MQKNPNLPQIVGSKLDHQQQIEGWLGSDTEYNKVAAKDNQLIDYVTENCQK